MRLFLFDFYCTVRIVRAEDAEAALTIMHGAGCWDKKMLRVNMRELIPGCEKLLSGAIRPPIAGIIYAQDPDDGSDDFITEKVYSGKPGTRAERDKCPRNARKAKQPDTR